MIFTEVVVRPQEPVDPVEAVEPQDILHQRAVEDEIFGLWTSESL